MKFRFIRTDINFYFKVEQDLKEIVKSCVLRDDKWSQVFRLIGTESLIVRKFLDNTFDINRIHLCENDILKDKDGNIFKIVYDEVNFNLLNTHGKRSRGAIYWGELEKIGECDENPTLFIIR
jgi:hypothetical protein